MSDYINPYNYKKIKWQPATSEKIKHFYENDFLRLIENNPSYLHPRNISEFGISLVNPVTTTHGPREFIRRKNIDIDSYEKLQKVCLDLMQNDPQKRILEDSYPKGIYFGLTDIQKYGWLLAFDIDAKNIAKKGLCSLHNGQTNGKLTSEQTKIVKSLPPEDYLYCFNCLYLSIQYAYQVRTILKEWGFEEKNIRIYYSGQGTHIHVDSPSSWAYGTITREYIQKMLIEKYGIPLDPTVTCDTSRVLRYPGSLNAQVNRFVAEIGTENTINTFEKVIGNVQHRTSSIINSLQLQPIRYDAAFSCNETP